MEVFVVKLLDPVYSKSDSEILSEIGQMLKQRRINYNLTQQEFAEAVGISENHLSRIERTGKTSLSSFITISRKFELLPQLVNLYKNPELTPVQKYKIEEKTLKIRTGRKRVKK